MFHPFPAFGQAVLAGVLFGVCPSLVAAETRDDATLKVTVVNSDGRMVPSRAWVDAAGKRYFKPSSPPTCVPYARDRSFSHDGWFEISLPPGKVSLHIERGKEWYPIDQTTELAAGTSREIRIGLRRWVDMPSEGYYSSDFHVHFGYDDPRVLRQLALADDVHLVPAFTYWLRGTEPRWPTQWPAWPAGRRIRVDDSHVITRDNLEIERIRSRARPGGSVGASFLFNLDRPVSVQRFDPRFPSDTTLCLQAKDVSPDCVIDTDKPSWGETVIGAALGVYDVAEVCHNHYHRNATLPGGWGMIGPLAPEERPLTEPDELFHRTNQQYYHWLNCGIRMGVSGGSAMGVMAVPLGYNRTYAKIEGPLSARKFWKAVREGNTFATSGPMLTMTVQGHAPGGIVALARDAARVVEIQIRLRSIDRIDRLELIHNGMTTQQRDLGNEIPDPSIDLRVSWRHRPSRSGWYAARALFRSPDGGLREAHTSPVYLLLDAKPIAFKASADYMIRWVDRLMEIANLPGRYRSPADRDQVRRVYRRARAFYQKVAKDASEYWGD